MNSLLKRCIAEAIGTAVLVFCACGVAGFGSSQVAISLAFGLVIVAMAYSIGNVSGCHINPAVSLAMLIRKKLTVKEFLFYVISQVVGAFVGALLLAACFRSFDALGTNLIQPVLADEVTMLGEVKYDAWSYIGALVAEVVLTFIFVIAILGVTDSKFNDGKVAGIVIGLALVLVHLIGLTLTGTSVNPARSLAPSMLQAMFGSSAESLKQVWIWILGPLAGGALAAVVYGFLTKSKEEAKTEE